MVSSVYLGAQVILACRDESRAKAAIDDIKNLAPNSSVQFMKLDLASFQSVRDFVSSFSELFTLFINVFNLILLSVWKHLSLPSFTVLCLRP